MRSPQQTIFEDFVVEEQGQGLVNCLSRILEDKDNNTGKLTGISQALFSTGISYNVSVEKTFAIHTFNRFFVKLFHTSSCQRLSVLLRLRNA